MAERKDLHRLGPTRRERECVNRRKREAAHTLGKRVFTADPVAAGKKQTDEISCRRPASVKPRCFS